MNVGELLSTLALAIALAGGIGIPMAMFGWMRHRMNQLFAGSEGDNVGELLSDHSGRLRELVGEIKALGDRQEKSGQDLSGQLEEARQSLADRCDELERRAERALRHTYVHKYSIGSGPESAVVVQLDDRGNGSLISVMAGSSTRVYTRVVQNWQAQELAQQDEQALRKAQEIAKEA